MPNTSSIPPGFKRLEGRSPFIAGVGPLYWRAGDNEFTMGLLVEQRHCNALGICHGGMLLTLADVAMGTAAMYLAAPRKMLLTVGLTCNFVANAKEGEWLEATAQCTAVTFSLAFVALRVAARSQTVLSGVGTFHVPREDTPGFDLHAMLA